MTDMIEVTKHDANNYCLVLRALGLEEEGDPVAEIEKLRADNESLRIALKWYADGEHFGRTDQTAWDTVSGEAHTWWCDEAGTAMVEDGTLAKMVLDGKLTGLQLQALEDGGEA